MAENNFIIDLIAHLKKSQSKKQVQTDAKNLGDIKVPLIGTLNKTKTRAQLKQDLASLNGTVNLTGKVDKKGMVTSVQQATQQAQKKVNAQPVEINFSVKKDKLVNDIKLLGRQNSKLFKDVGMSQKYTQLLDSAQLANSTKELNNLRLQLGAFRSELKVTGNAGMTLTDALKSGLSKTLQLFGSYGIIMQFTKHLRNAWTEAKELDSAMTDLSRVNSEITRSGFPDYLDKVISKTKQLAVATKDYIDSVTTFSRAGYNLADSEILSDKSVQLMKVGDMDAESASKALLSGLQGYAEIDGYGMDQLAEKAQALNDKIDILGNTASITQAELSEGIQAVGSVMSDANTSVDEFLSLLSAGNRSVQDANKVALAIRTSALRIRGCTLELQAMNEETDDVIESTSTLAAKIKALTNINGSGGVDILEADEETFRSIYDIYNDISKVYSEMSDTDASALLDLIAGKNRSNQISAVLNNMSEANELLNRSLNATGTASEEYEIYLNSAQAATERFGVAMTEAYSNVINGETVKSLVNAGTAVLDFANSFGILEGTLKGFLALGILKGITTLTVALKNSAVQASNFGTALNTVNKLGSLARNTKDYADAMNTLTTKCVGLTEAQLKQILSNRNLLESQRLQILQCRGLTKAEAQAKLTQMGLTDAIIAQNAANTTATTSTFSLSAAVKGLGANIKTAFFSNPIGIIILGLSTAIGIFSSAISKSNQKAEEAIQKAKEAAGTFKETSSSIDDYVSKYKELQEQLIAAKGNEEETYNVKQQLLELQTELNEKYGDEYQKVNLVTDAYKDQTEAIKQLNKESAQRYLNENKKSVDKATSEMTKTRNYKLGSSAELSNSEAQEVRKRILDLASEFDNIEITTSGIIFSGTALEADETINEFMTKVRELQENYKGSGEVIQNVFDDVLDSSTNALGKTSSVLETYQDVYEQAQMAQIASDTSLSKGYNEAVSAVEDYNEAVLKSEDPYNDENVKKAWDNLQTVKQGIQDNEEEWGQYSNIMDNVFSSANDEAYSFSQALQNDDSLVKLADDLKGLSNIDLQAMTDDGDNGDSFDELCKAAEEYGLGVQDVIDLLVKLGYVQGEVQNAIKDKEVSTSFTAFTEEQSKSIDDFQSKVKTLGDALSSLQSGDTIVLTDLIQEFPELAGQSDDLEQAIQQLIYNALQELYDTLGQGLPTDVKDDLQSIADSASGVAPDLNTAFASIQKSYDAMHEFKDAMDTDGLTESILSNVGSLSSYMNQMVAGFHAGTVSADQLYQALTEHYNNDLKNYGNALIAKNLYSEDFYNAVGISSAKVVNEFNKNYGVDIQNCKDYNSAKLRIEQQTLGKISEIWGKYYDAQSMTYKPALDLLKQSAMNGNAQAQKDYAQVMQYTNAHKNATNALNKIVYEGINTSFDEIGHNIDGNGKGSSTKEDKETKETFDFIETAIKRIEAAIDKVKSKAEDTFSTFSSRSKSYAETIKTITDEISLQEQAKQKYMERRDSIGLDEYWAAQVRDGSLNIADITDDALKEQINEYGEWNDKVIECTESVANLKKEQEELVRESIELLITKYGKLETKASNAAGKVQDRIDLKEAWGGSAKASDYNSMNKSVAKQVGYLEKQNTELKKLQKSVPRTSEAWYDYQEQIDSNSSSIQDLTKSMAENAQAAASLAKTKADLKVDKYDSKDELYNAKIENATTAKSKNSLIDNEISNIGNRQKAYNTAVKTSTKKLNSSASAINGLKSKKTNTKNKTTNAENKNYNTVLKKVKAQIKSGKRIGTSLLNKTTGLNDDLALYNACVQYNAYLDAKEENETIAELYAETAKSEKNALALQKFNNVAAEYGNKIQMSDYQMTALDNKISETETAGKKVERSYYDTQKKINAEKLAQYQAEKSALEESIKGIKQGTDEWYEAYDQIQNVSSSISDCVKETYELNNAINQLHFDQFNDTSESIGRIITEQEFLRGLFAHEKNTDTKTGNFTDAGFANLGSLSASYYASKERAENDGIELQKLKAILDKGANADGTYGDADLTFNSLEDLQKEIDKTYTTWQNDIKETYSVESEIADLMKEKYQAELDMLQELINAKKEALQSEKDLHDYQQSINEKTKDITTIQKQIAAYSGDSSEEAMAKLQKLQKELADKEEDLRETEYDRYISDQEDMLNKLYEEYEELVTKKLEDFMTLVREGLDTANSNTAIIANYFSKVAKDNGYDIETDGLFSGSSGGIGENVGKAVADIEKDKTATDDNKKPAQTGSNNSGTTLPDLSGSQFIIDTTPKRESATTSFDTAKSYIKKNVKDAEMAKNKYSAVNQKIYDNRSGAYKGNGKILPTNKLKGLAEKLGVAYNGGGKDGRLYKKLKEIKFPGFKKGGIVSVDDIEKQVHDNGDDGIVSVKNGEGILTQKQTEALEKFTEKLPEKDGIIRMPDGVELTPVSPEDFIKMLQARSADKQTPDLGGMAKPDLQDLSGFMKPILPDLSGMVKFEPPEVPSAGNTNNVLNIDNITLPNVTNAEEFADTLIPVFQRKKGFERLLDHMITERLTGAGKLNKYRPL